MKVVVCVCLWRQVPDPVIGRFKSIDPHAERYLSHAVYSYVGNNPILRIDPDGRDWFVNNDTGEVIYIRAQSTVTQEYLDNKGIAHTASSYERLGPDYMFGDRLSYGASENILTRDYAYMDNARDFMKHQGYEKAERVKIMESEYVMSGALGSEERINITVNDLKQLGDSKITYITPDHLNEKTNVKTSLSDEGKWNTIERTRYTLTKPYGQSNAETATFGDKGNIEKSTAALGTLVDWIFRYFER